MTQRKFLDPDAITAIEAAQIVGRPVEMVRRLRREGTFGRLPGGTTYSRQEAERFRADQWLRESKPLTYLAYRTYASVNSQRPTRSRTGWVRPGVGSTKSRSSKSSPMRGTRASLGSISRVQIQRPDSAQNEASRTTRMGALATEWQL